MDDAAGQFLDEERVSMFGGSSHLNRDRFSERQYVDGLGGGAVDELTLLSETDELE